ncbi:MAG: VOC family protein [Anaerolineae bacterium]|nr:VOC family protein [Anaerolineae bacterium]
MSKLTPNLWFDSNAEEAVEFYCSVFKNSRVNRILHYGPEGPGAAGAVMTIDFELDGQPFTAINGGPYYQFTPAVSFVIDCHTQEEVDYYWERLLAGGEAEQCGWLRDRYGLSWQVVPVILIDMLLDPDPARARRVTKAMLGMVKLDIAALRQAYQQG